MAKNDLVTFDSVSDGLAFGKLALGRLVMSIKD